MDYKILRGTTSKLIEVFIESTLASSGLTGLTNTSPGLTCYYLREGDAAPTQVLLIPMTIGTWISSGFKEINSVTMPGVYQIGLPDAFLSIGNSNIMFLTGASNMKPVKIVVELDAVNYQDSVKFGLSNLDTTISSRAATSGTALDVIISAQVAGVSGQINTLNTSVISVSGLVAAIKAKTDNLPTDPADASDIAASFGTVANTLSAMQTIINSIQAKTTNLPAVPAAVGSKMTLDMTQAVPTSNTPGTVGDSFNAARAQGFGTWILTGNILNMYAADGDGNVTGTVVRSFIIDDPDTPRQRI